MSDTVNQVVWDVRSLLSGTVAQEMSLLATQWTPGQTQITLSVERRVAPGSLLSIGLTTFHVLSVSGPVATVIPSPDGSPANEPIDQGAVVVIRPLHTTWQIVQGINATIDEVSSPMHGLFGTVEETHPVDVVHGTYSLTQTPLKVLRVRYLEPGSTDTWHDLPFDSLPGAPDGPQVRTLRQAPGGSTIHVQYAVPYRAATSLSTTLDGLNIPPTAARLLAVGAARSLSLATESRRAQPLAQGDPRRAEEVPSTGNVVVYDRLSRDFRNLVAAERARLIALYPYRWQMERFTGAHA